MRLEVLVGDDEPKVYPLNIPKLSIGSSENCDIYLSVDGISRKHLGVITEDDNYFVVDLGSSNGSYINEERLIPGRRVEFTSFFPVRLGSNVLVSLISDEEGELTDKIEFPVEPDRMDQDLLKKNNDDKTSVISLKELNVAKTERLVQTRNKKRVVSKSTIQVKQSKKSKRNWFAYLIVLSFSYAAYFNISKIRENQPEDKISQVGIEVVAENSKSDKQRSIEENINTDLVSDDQLTPRENYQSLKDELKCTTEVEKLLCDFFSVTRSDNFFGVVQVGLSAHVLVDGSSYLNKAESLLTNSKNLSPAALSAHNSLIDNTSVYLFWIDVIQNKKLDISKLSDFKISIAFYVNKNNNYELLKVIAIKPEVINKLDKVVNSKFLVHIKKAGPAVIKSTSSYYKVY